MSSREKILTAITTNKPNLSALPVINLAQVTNYNDLVAKFTATLEGIGGKVFELKSMEELASQINNERNNRQVIISNLNDDAMVNSNQSAFELERLDKAYLRADIGVAENGAVWIREFRMINRLLPFICQHLVVVLEKQKLVATMHHAYQQINAFEEGFGVFIAGPSKTADIEQSLVIGAHGARSMTVCLLD
ncbi:MAG: LUD domain-containing protein [Bacteroidota bacterium]